MKKENVMEQELDMILAAKMGNNKDCKDKPKTERRRSSIFSLLKMKKLSRQFSEPTQVSNWKLNRKFSVDSALLTDYNKNQDVCDVFDKMDTIRVNGG